MAAQNLGIAVRSGRPQIPEWSDPACWGMDAEMFFYGEREKIAVAKAVCACCPVVEACREWAIEHEEFGVWGGTDEAERRAMRRSMGLSRVRR